MQKILCESQKSGKRELTDNGGFMAKKDNSKWMELIAEYGIKKLCDGLNVNIIEFFDTLEFRIRNQIKVAQKIGA